jgi:hypothetical protein
MNAENVPNVRQSRAVRGLKKLSAKKIKTAELTMTRDHRPYAGVSCMVMLLVRTAVLVAMHQHVHQRARQEKEIRKNPKKMSPVLRPQQHSSHQRKSGEGPDHVCLAGTVTVSRPVPRAALTAAGALGDHIQLTSRRMGINL